MGVDSDYLHVCLTETCSIYRLGISRLGVCHVTDGLVAVLIGAGLMWLNQGTIWSGIGVWTGLPIMLTGVVCLFSRQKKSRGKISGVTLMCIVSMGCAGFAFTTAAYNIDRVLISENFTDHFPRYHLQDESPLLACNSLLMVFGLVEFVVSIWSAALSIGIVCICCHMGRDRVFTIPYKGMDDNNDGPRGPDIVTPRSAARPTTSAFLEQLADDSGLPDFSGPSSMGAAHTGGVTGPPVLHIDMDMEWDEMVIPVTGDEIDMADTVNSQRLRDLNDVGVGRW